MGDSERACIQQVARTAGRLKSIDERESMNGECSSRAKAREAIFASERPLRPGLRIPYSIWAQGNLDWQRIDDLSSRRETVLCWVEYR